MRLVGCGNGIFLGFGATAFTYLHRLVVKPNDAEKQDTANRRLRSRSANSFSVLRGDLMLPIRPRRTLVHARSNSNPTLRGLVDREWCFAVASTV